MRLWPRSEPRALSMRPHRRAGGESLPGVPPPIPCSCPTDRWSARLLDETVTHLPPCAFAPGPSRTQLDFLLEAGADDEAHARRTHARIVALFGQQAWIQPRDTEAAIKATREQPEDDDRQLDPQLVAVLRDAGDKWGPLGVAEAASGFTDRDTLIRHLLAAQPSTPTEEPEQPALCPPCGFQHPGSHPAPAESCPINGGPCGCGGTGPCPPSTRPAEPILGLLSFRSWDGRPKHPVWPNGPLMPDPAELRDRLAGCTCTGPHLDACPARHNPHREVVDVAHVEELAERVRDPGTWDRNPVAQRVEVASIARREPLHAFTDAARILPGRDRWGRFCGDAATPEPAPDLHALARQADIDAAEIGSQYRTALQKADAAWRQIGGRP